MTDYMKQMLDELLGRNRDAAPGQGIPEKRFDDPDVRPH